MQERSKQGSSLPAELAIIVGRGRHTQAEGPKLREAVEQLLHQHLHLPLAQLQVSTSTTAQVSASESQAAYLAKVFVLLVPCRCQVGSFSQFMPMASSI